MNFDLSTIDLQRRAVAIGSALLILVLGWLFAAWAGSAVRRASEYNQRVSPTLVPLFAKLTRLSLVLVVVVAALDELGIQTSGIFAALGAAGLALGLALKDTTPTISARPKSPSKPC
jgi:small conductance mechanosensitive channel